MQRPLTGAACAFVIACALPALANDFHPLVSLTLPGGIHAHDDILIPRASP